jgi:hypothetical protein
LDLGNGGEYYGSCKQVLSQSNGSTSDFKSTSTKGKNVHKISRVEKHLQFIYL